ncbi:hypothetical protein INR49_022631 [Caranx melampygus]|nr:hypothetical protein INR49_022631 [Caranx melampygus]
MLSYMDYVTQGALEPRSRVSAVMTPGNTADDQLITTHKPVSFNGNELLSVTDRRMWDSLDRDWDWTGLVWGWTGTGPSDCVEL